MEKPTTDNLKALGYKLSTGSPGAYCVRRPSGWPILDSFAKSPKKAWDLAREFVAREIEATTQPKENKPC